MGEALQWCFCLNGLQDAGLQFMTISLTGILIEGECKNGSISFFYSLSLKSVLLSPIESKNLCSSLKIQECMGNTSSQ